MTRQMEVQSSAADVRTLLAAAAARLEHAGVPSPMVDAELLLAHVRDVPRGALRTGPDPTDRQRQVFDELVARRCTREPLQHLTGTAAFRHRDLAVGPGVFVPRPETEVLVEWALARAAACERPHPVVVDLCTGSGAIAASLADEAPAAWLYAVELCESAYDYARCNLVGTGVDLRRGDIAYELGDLDGHVDVVVANPPYVPLHAWADVAPEARDHDPEVALWAGDDGLDAIRSVEQVAHRLLRSGGYVGCEHADEHRETASRVFAGRWAEVGDHRDFAGRSRFVTARKP